MLGKIAGALIGAKMGGNPGQNSMAGAVIGTATAIVARRFLPARFAMLGATIAGGYLTKKWAEREQARQRVRDAAASGSPAAVAIATNEAARVGAIEPGQTTASGTEALRAVN